MSKRADDPSLADTIEEIVRQAGAQLEPREPATDTTMTARTN